MPIEWVELPNTLGMSQFADGGFLGSKPYAAGGNYINKMSDYCAGCRYKISRKTGKDACPFNYLYWDFLARNQDKLKGNPRLGPVYRTWTRMDPDKKKAYRASARSFLDRSTNDGRRPTDDRDRRCHPRSLPKARPGKDHLSLRSGEGPCQGQG